MTADRTIETHTLQWRGVSLEITFERDWFGIASKYDLAASHLTVRAIEPKRGPLPITETGYRSHFLSFEDVERAGGPTAYVEVWLDTMARSREWLEYEQTRRQLSLF